MPDVTAFRYQGLGGPQGKARATAGGSLRVHSSPQPVLCHIKTPRWGCSRHQAQGDTGTWVTEHAWVQVPTARAGPSRITYPDLLIEPQAAAVEDEVAIMEAACGQAQAQEAAVLSELHHAMLGLAHVAGWGRSGVGMGCAHCGHRCPGRGPPMKETALSCPSL